VINSSHYRLNRGKKKKKKGGGGGGIRVSHDVENFAPGSTTILTLVDHPILPASSSYEDDKHDVDFDDEGGGGGGRRGRRRRKNY